MTLQHFQIALANLIRNPPLFLAGYELSADEVLALEHFARDRLVKDFSAEMRDKRWSAICRVTSCLHPFIAPRQLKELCREDFEAKHAQTHFADIALAFLDYLAHDEHAKSALRELVPNYFADLVEYLYTVSYFSLNVSEKHGAPAPGSLLSHTCLSILELEYDVRELAEEIIEPRDLKRTEYLAQEDDTSGEELLQRHVNAEVEKRPLTLLFVAEQTPTEFRSFEIDADLKNFLIHQLRDPTVPTPLPGCYADLVELGLCSPLNEVQRLAHEIRAQLNEVGFCHLKQGLSEEQFKEIAAQLGTIVASDDIKLNLSRRKLHSPGALEFHTDSYLSDINAWWCEQPAESGGAMMLVDTTDILKHFSQSEMDGLTQIEMECPNRTHTKFFRRQLLMRAHGTTEIYYTPWLPVEPAADELKNLRDKFAAYVESKRNTGAVEILFSRGDCLFINNKRILHGRDSLDPNTKRHFKRLWIATQSFDARLLE